MKITVRRASVFYAFLLAFFAGVAFLESVHKELCKGASGAGVRTLVNYLLEA